MYAKVFLFSNGALYSCSFNVCVENRLWIVVSTAEDATLQRFLLEETLAMYSYQGWIVGNIGGVLQSKPSFEVGSRAIMNKLIEARCNET